MTPALRSVAIVGGGVAGLAAAYRLTRAGARVRVLESRAHLGGRAWTDDIDGCRVDAGAQLLGSMYERTLRLMDDLGIRDRLRRAPGRDALFKDGRAHEVTYGSVGSMLASGALPLGTKLRLGSSYVPFLARHAGNLELAEPERAARAGLDGESIAAWGARELGPEFVEYLVYPQLSSFYGSEPEETTAGLYHVLARHGMNVTLYALPGGIGGLCDALARRVEEGGGEVRLSTAVRRVEVGDDGVEVTGEGWAERFDAAVLAVPAPLARALLHGAPEPMTGWLDQVRYRPAVNLALLLDRPLDVRYFGLSLPRDVGRTVSTVCVLRNKGVEAGEGCAAVLALAAPRAAPDLLEAEPREVLDRMLPEVAHVLPEVRDRIVRARVYRWPEGHAVFYPGYLGRLAAFRGGGIEGRSRVALAGDYLYSPTIEGAVTSGLAAAARLLPRLEDGPAI